MGDLEEIRPGGHDIGISFTAPVEALGAVVTWFRDVAGDALPAMVELGSERDDHWVDAPIELWRLNVDGNLQVRTGRTTPIERVRWAALESSLRDGKVARAFATPTFRVATWPNGPPQPILSDGPIRLTMHRIGWIFLRYPEPPEDVDDGVQIDFSLCSSEFDATRDQLRTALSEPLDRAIAQIPQLTIGDS